MARKLTSREYSLLGVLAIVALIVVYVQGGKELLGGGKPATPEREPPAPGDAPVVRMVLLTKEPEPYDPNGRDLFKFADRPLTRAEREARRRAEEERLRRLAEEAERQRLAALARQKAEEQRQVAAPQVAQQPARPSPPRVPYEYVGYLGPKDDKIGVFVNGDDVLVAQVGETLGDSFLVKEFKYQSVVIGYTEEQFKDRSTELKQANAK